MTEEVIRLTKYAHGAGCGCKMAPQLLDEILKTESIGRSFDSLLVGVDTKDDAAVYRLNESEALIATTDFFTPIVDDPFIFGQVAAANAISDVYAMGGTPILALAILGWPVEKLPASVAREVLEGARKVCSDIGIPLAGGHSIDQPEPVFGLAVNGLVSLKNLKQNNNAKEGDILLLTKPIGVGVLSTAAKRDALEPHDLGLLHRQLTLVNSVGAELAKLEAVHALTDVTGFGLAGHLIEMADGAGLSAEIDYSAIPKISGIQKYLQKNIIPDATYRNWKAYSEKIELTSTISALEAFQLLPDPQTNGGLLIACSPQALEVVADVLIHHGYEAYTTPIGRFTKRKEKVVVVS